MHFPTYKKRDLFSKIFLNNRKISHAVHRSVIVYVLFLIKHTTDIVTVYTNRKKGKVDRLK